MCERSYTVDLIHLLMDMENKPRTEISRMEMANFLDTCPAILFNQRIKGTEPNYGDIYRLQIYLLFSEQQTLVSPVYDTGVLTCTKDWTDLNLQLTGFPKGIRFIRIHGMFSYFFLFWNWLFLLCLIFVNWLLFF